MGICTDHCLLCCSVIAARLLSCLTGITHRTQDLLNNLWYRLALFTLEKFSRWPNYSTGHLNVIKEDYTNEIPVSQEITRDAGETIV